MDEAARERMVGAVILPASSSHALHLATLLSGKLRGGVVDLLAEEKIFFFVRYLLSKMIEAPVVSIEIGEPRIAGAAIEIPIKEVAADGWRAKVKGRAVIDTVGGCLVVDIRVAGAAAVQGRGAGSSAVVVAEDGIVRRNGDRYTVDFAQLLEAPA